jgi:acyl-coenzyme A synthetase/AMP-(fatty) acid ligase
LRIHAFGGALVNARFPETGENLATLIRDFGVTQLSASPWQLRRLLQSEGLSSLRSSPLRALVLAGAIVAPEDIRASREKITPNVYVIYGSSEFGMMACLRPEDTDLVAGKVGKLLPGIEGQAVDDNDAPLSVGKIGKLRFRRPGMVQGYVGNEEATALHFRHGWFYPGDVGLIDADDAVTVKGRVDDIINVGGGKVAPEDIEPVLKRHPDIEDAALVGVPDPMSGERAVAFVVARRNIATKDFYDFLAMRISATELPNEIVSVPGIPRNPEGKILRDRLRDIYFMRLAKRTGPESKSGS